MFSSTMIASSTTMPTTRVRPSTVYVLSVKPNTYMTMNVPRIDVGIASRTLSVVDHEPRKTQQTRLVRRAARMRVKRISLIARSMKTVVSKLTARKSPSGSCFSISASLARTSRPTWTAFAPRSLVMPNPMAGSAVGPGEAAAVLEAVLDHRDVPHAHRRAAPVGDDEVAEVLDVDRLALGADVHLAVRSLDAAGGHLEVLALDRGVHVRRR